MPNKRLTTADLEVFFAQADAQGVKSSREELVQELVNQGVEIEGLNAPKESKGFFDYINAPADVASGLINRGFSSAASAFGYEKGAEAGQRVYERNVTPQKIEMAGDTLQTTASIGAGIGTAGIGFLPSVAAAAGTGMATEALDVASEQIAGKDIAPSDYLTRPIKQGATDGTIDALTFGLAKVLSPVAKTLKNSAKASVMKVLSPTTKQNKVIAQKLAPEILQRPAGETYAVTLQGLADKAKMGREAAGEAFDSLGELQGSTPTKAILDFLQEEKAGFVAGGKVVDQGAVDSITAVQDIFAQYGDEIDNNTLRTIGQILSKGVARKGGFQKASGELADNLEFQKIAANKIRDVLAEASPDLAKLNKEYTFWKNLSKLTSDATQRKAGQSSGLVSNIATVVGAGSAAPSGPAGMAGNALLFRAVAQATQSPGWRLASARVKNNLADAIALGRTKDVMSIIARIGSSQSQ